MTETTIGNLKDQLVSVGTGGSIALSHKELQCLISVYERAKMCSKWANETISKHHPNKDHADVFYSTLDDISYILDSSNDVFTTLEEEIKR